MAELEYQLADDFNGHICIISLLINILRYGVIPFAALLFSFVNKYLFGTTLRVCIVNAFFCHSKEDKDQYPRLSPDLHMHSHVLVCMMWHTCGDQSTASECQFCPSTR